MTRATRTQLGLLAGGLAYLLVAVPRWLAPATPAAWRAAPWWLLFWITLVVLWQAAQLLRPVRRARHAARQARQESQAATQAAVDELRARLQRLRGAFDPAQLTSAADQLRRSAATGPQPLIAARRLLAVSGPSSAAWLSLAEAESNRGDVVAALRCAAEAVRCGYRTTAELGALAQQLEPEDAALASPAALLAVCGDPARAARSDLPQVYRALRELDAPLVLRATAGQALFSTIDDPEEAARWREQMRSAEVLDPTLRTWIVDAWADYDATGQWRAAPGAGSAAPAWTHLMSADWRAALGAGGAPENPWAETYAPPLPIYGLDSPSQIAALAEQLDKRRRPPAAQVFASLSDPQTIRDYLTDQLWPRQVRGRAVINDALSRLSQLKADSRVAAGLERIGDALAEELDPQADDLRSELERQAQTLPTGEPRARALHAAGTAWQRRDLSHARELWDEARRLALRLDRTVAGEALGRMVPAWLGAAASSDPTRAAAALTTAVKIAVASRRPAALARVARAVLATTDRALQEGLVEQLRAAAESGDGRLAFLLSWSDGDLNGAVRATMQIWQGDFSDQPRAAGPAAALARLRSQAEPTDWSWLPLAVADRAAPGDEDPLGRLVVFLHDRGQAGDLAAYAGWLACGYKLDRLQQRRGTPRAKAALDQLRGLPPTRLRLPLTALRSTLAEATPSWLATVEETLLERVKQLAEREWHDTPAEREMLSELLEVLATARVRAAAASWLEQYEADVRAWVGGQ